MVKTRSMIKYEMRVQQIRDAALRRYTEIVEVITESGRTWEWQDVIRHLDQYTRYSLALGMRLRFDCIRHPDGDFFEIEVVNYKDKWDGIVWKRWEYRNVAPETGIITFTLQELCCLFGFKPVLAPVEPPPIQTEPRDYAFKAIVSDSSKVEDVCDEQNEEV